MIVCASDVHLHPHNAWSTVENGWNSRLLDGWKAIEEISNRAGEGGYILILGDWFEDRRSIPISAMEMTCRWFDLCHSRRQKIWLLTGNHDQEWRSGEVHSLGLLQREYVTVIDQPKTVRFDSHKIIADFVPFHPDPQVTLKNITDIHRSYEAPGGFQRILMLHAEFYGAVMDSGDICSKGLRPGDIPDGYDLVLSGHFHAPQKIGKVSYIGSPYQLSAGEAGNMNRVFLLHDGQFESSPIDVCPKFYRISLEEARTTKEEHKKDFIIIDCSDAKQIDAASAEFQGCQTRMARPPAVKVSYTSGKPKDVIASWLKARDRERLIPQAYELFDASESGGA